MAGVTSQSWVACDRCNKWRRIPTELHQSLADDEDWLCEFNPNKAFASCSVPQELSDAEIDAIEAAATGSGDEDEEDEFKEERARRRRMPAIWQLIKENILTHRKRKVQDEDDVMVCQCKPTWRGGDGCGPDCINRMLCIECTKGFCPCEDKCTNQVFTQKQYAKLEVRRAGAKGMGLFALEDIPSGNFIIEYIGEVLEEEEYLRRKDFYALVGQRHYYFMNIGNGEVIDAARKGNRARFINHSCDPNCETQKWLARGELAIGLFALKDIKAGEELTFDYNFERYGDRPMRCYCQSKTCRKFVGGTQDAYDESMLVDPEDVTNDYEPIMLTDSDMDWAARALLEGRISASTDRNKEPAVLAKLEKLCRARGVPWTVAHYHAQEGEAVAAVAAESKAGTGDASQPVVKEEVKEEVADEAPAVASPPATTAGGGARGGRRSGARRGRGGARSARRARGKKAPEPEVKAEESEGEEEEKEGKEQKQENEEKEEEEEEEEEDKEKEEKGVKEGQEKEEREEKEEKEQQMGTVPRGPLKAAFKQMKAKQLQEEAGSAASPNAAVKEESPPLTLLKAEALAVAKPAPRRRKRVTTRTTAQSEAPTPSGASTATPLPQQQQLQQQQLQQQQQQPSSRRPATSTEASAAQQAATTATSAASQQTQLGGAGAQSQLGGTAGGRKVQAGGARKDAGGFKKRSEIDRRLDGLVGPSGRLKDASKQNIIKVLRMFNLCDIGPNQGRSRPLPAPERPSAPSNEDQAGASSCSRPAEASTNGYHASALGSKDERSEVQGDGAGNGDRIGGSEVNGPGPPISSGGARGAWGGSDRQPPVMTARQRARMADLSLLLDVILKTTSATVKRDFVACGVLNQLQQAVKGNMYKECYVILRKILRVVESLPLTADDVYSKRSAHGTFANILQELSTNQDYDVRTKAAMLLRKFPMTACQDPHLLQQLGIAPPRARGPSGFSPALPHLNPSHTNGPHVLKPPTPSEHGSFPATPNTMPSVGCSPHLGSRAPGLPPPHRPPSSWPPSSMPLASPSSTLDAQQHQHQTPLPLLQAQHSTAATATLDPSASTQHQQHAQAHLHGGLPLRPDSPTAKRQRVCGFSSGPMLPSLDGAALQGVQQATDSLSPAPAGDAADGAALLSPNIVEGGELHPPPLDAEDLFELLQVPVHVADRARPPLLPPLIPTQQPQHSSSDAQQPPLGPHGEPTQMEIIFALGVYDRDWVAAGRRASKGKGRGVTHRGKKLGESSLAEGVGVGSGDSDSGGEDEVRGCPLSPIDHPAETLSPVRPELCELEVDADARRLQQHQQRQLQQQGLSQGQGVGADGIPMVMDLRTRATAAGHLGSYSTFSAQDMSGSGSGLMDVDPLQPALLASTAAHAAHVVRSQDAIPEVSMDDAWQTNGVQGNGNVIPEPQEDPDIVEWTRSMPQDYPETWDEPDLSFESFVSETVRYRLGKYVTLPDVASRVPSKDCHNLSRKIKREVIQKEKEAFEGRRVQGLFKLIERKKVQHNLYEFVRHSCKRWHAHKAEMKAQKHQQPSW